MNIGEWSEFYAFLKLLADGEIYGADGNLNRIDDWVYPLRSISRDSQCGAPLKYIVCQNLGLIKIEGSKKEIEQREFHVAALELLREIKAKEKVDVTTFEPFIQKIDSPRLNAGKDTKRDISLTLHDVQIGRDIDFGFSIKSMLGGKSTLFNASQTTGFIYEVIGYDKLEPIPSEDFSELKPRDFIGFLYENGCSLSFVSTENVQFRKNLQIIDSRMDEIVSELVVSYYLQDILKKKIDINSTVRSLVNHIERADPLCFGAEGQSFYVYKIKQFLTACALGLTASAPWMGQFDASGGYLIVKEDGSLVCYHIYNWNCFQDYLYDHTAFDTPSTTRHKFGKIYTENGKSYIKLNFQIRFNLSSKSP